MKEGLGIFSPPGTAPPICHETIFKMQFSWPTSQQKNNPIPSPTSCILDILQEPAKGLKEPTHVTGAKSFSLSFSW